MLRLQSEGFERAAFALQRSLDQPNFGEFVEAVRRFEAAVERLATIQSMVAANEERRGRGLAPAYGEGDFVW